MEKKEIVAKIVTGKGSSYDQCICYFNIDIESGICSVALDENGKADKSKICSYCYAAYKHSADADSYRVKTIKESEFKKIAEKHELKILRIGKFFECGHRRTREQLYQVLEYCIKYDIRPIVTSKVLEFDPKVSQLVKESDGIVHISLGDDRQETGALLQGSTNDWRLAQAILYREDGCPVQTRIIADVTIPMSEFNKHVYAKMGSKGILLTPLRYLNKELFSQSRPDTTWEDAKSDGSFQYDHGLKPMRAHSDWSVTKERCGYIGNKEFCNNCVRKISFSKAKWYESLVASGWIEQE